MKKNIYSILFFLLTLIVIYTSNVFSQVQLDWVRTYQGPVNGGESYFTKVDNLGNIIAAGNNYGSAIAKDIVTIKYTVHGDTIWVRRYSNGAECSIEGLAVDSFGNIFVTGFDNQSGQPKCITIKYSPTGDILWQKIFSNSTDDRPVGIGIDAQGFVYIAGVRNSSNSDGWGYFALKYNPDNGDTIWTSKYDYIPNSTEIAMAMTVDGTGNIFICGYSNADSVRSAVIKINSSGQLQWASLYKIPNVSGFLHGNSIKVDALGNVYIAGQAYNGQASFDDYLIIKYNPDGSTAWVKTYSQSTASDLASDLAIDNSGNIFVTGATFVIGQGGSNNYNYLTLKLDGDGNILWTKNYDGTAISTQDEARAITLDQYGDCYVTGGSSVSPLFYAAEFATIKYSSAGEEVWAIRHASYFGGYSITVDQELNVYVTGAINAHNALIKYYQDILPVELNSFTASLHNNCVILNWITSSETNNKGFEIERSVESKNSNLNAWASIGFITGNGTTTIQQHYNFSDENISAGKYSYRLKQIDFDGSYELSTVVEIDVNGVNTFSLNQNYPNPFNPVTKINWQSPIGSWQTLKIYDVLGNEVATLVDEFRDAGAYEVEFNNSGLASGMYFYSLIVKGNDGTNFISTKKMSLIK